MKVISRLLDKETLQRHWKVHHVEFQYRQYQWGNNTNSDLFIFPNWTNKLFSEENKVSRTLFEARKVAGSATYKQSKTELNCVVL